MPWWRVARSAHTYLSLDKGTVPSRSTMEWLCITDFFTYTIQFRTILSYIRNSLIRAGEYFLHATPKFQSDHFLNMIMVNDVNRPVYTSHELIVDQYVSVNLLKLPRAESL